MSAYYNEIDPFAAAWLRELIKAKLIADGEVDERSIADVRPDDLRGFRQCHFFAGIGGWSYALRLAGWPDEREVWTGSCPCQPFSSAGAQAGGHDSRDLWPVWFQLIAECRPHVVFGEQVEAAIGHGWLDRLCDDLESEDYAIGPCGLPGPCVGAYDKRQRLWFVAQSSGAERGSWRAGCSGADSGGAHAELAGSSHAGTVADASRERRQQERRSASGDEGAHGRRSHGNYIAGCNGENGMADAEHDRARWRAAAKSSSDGPNHGVFRAHGSIGDMGDADDARSQGRQLSTECAGERAARPSGMADGFWSACDWLPCADGKARPVEPGTFPLAHGIPARVGRLRGYGNAIKPQLAAAFIEAYLSIGASE